MGRALQTVGSWPEKPNGNPSATWGPTSGDPGRDKSLLSKYWRKKKKKMRCAGSAAAGTRIEGEKAAVPRACLACHTSASSDVLGTVEIPTQDSFLH